MSIHRIAGRGERETRRADSLAEGMRQRILEIVRAKRGAISEQELATQLASDRDRVDGDAETVSSIRTQLYHLHLPKLADEGLVNWDRNAQAVRALDEETDSTRHSGRTEPADDSIDAVLTDDRQREIVAIVKATTDPILREDIARQLAGAESDAEPAESLVDEIIVQLHHHQLPKLDDDGFIEYDPDVGTVTAPGLQ